MSCDSHASVGDSGEEGSNQTYFIHPCKQLVEEVRVD